MKNYIGLKCKLADKILILNKYILLILLEGRENYVHIGHIFNRKVFLTSLFLKIDLARVDIDAGLAAKLKKKLLNIEESDKIIINILVEKKDDTSGKISMLKKISTAVKAYGAN